MKKRSFLAGMLTMALIGGLGFSALAASGQFTITVDPVNIQVNGQTFQPKDEKGNDVPVFAYNGTTYAPLRALAEAYGLEVGYDAGSNMATVKDPSEATPTTTPAPDTTATDYSGWSAEEEAAYQEFKGLWEVRFAETREGGEITGTRDVYRAFPLSGGKAAFTEWEQLGQATQDKFSYRWMMDIGGGKGVVLMLCEHEDSGWVYAFSIFQDGTFYPGHT